MIDHSFVGGGAANERPVDLADLPFFELGRNDFGYLGRANKNKDAACGPVETMNRGNSFSKLISKEIGGGNFVVCPAAMNSQARRFVDNDEVRVAV